MTSSPLSLHVPLPPRTIRGRLMLVAGAVVCLLFLALAAIAVSGLPFDLLPGEWRQRENEKTTLLAAIADKVKTELSEFFEERLDDIRVASASQKLKDLLSTPATDGERQQIVLQWLRSFQNAYKNYDRIEVVSTRDNLILLSTDVASQGKRFPFPDELPTGDNLPAEPKVFFERGKMDESPHLYLAVALQANEKGAKTEQASLVFSVNTHAIIEQLRTAGSGLLGDTGESFLVDLNGIILTPLRHPLAGGSTARPLVDRLPTQTSEYATWDIEGTLLVEDYRGVPVLAAVRHLRVLPDFGVGLIVKQDREEIFAPIRRSMITLGSVGLAGMVLAILLLSLVARNCLRPMEKVAAAAQRLGQGDLTARANAGKDDEVGVLAAAFNAMADEIQRWNLDLEERITRRTRELEAANLFLQKSETWLQAILDNSQDAIGVSKAGVHVFANPAYLRLFGYESQEEIAGRSTLDLIAPENRVMVSRFVEARKRGESAPASYETRGIRNNGETFDMDVHASLFELGGERFTLAILRDITERKKMEADHKALQEQILHLQKLEAVGTLAGGIAHDFNNILAAILGYAEIAEQDCPLGSHIRQSIMQIEKAGFRARDLVKQLLAFSRKQDNNAQGPVSPQLIVKEALKFLRATIPTTIDIQQHIDSRSGAVLADPVQIHQVLTNLCVNAVHAMEEKGGILQVTVDAMELSPAEAARQHGISPGCFVRLSVSDTGGGIAPAILNRIFDPYFTTKDVGKGSGMGLSIVHGIVRSLGGFIKVDNTPGEGVTFHVFLPRVRESLAQEPEIKFEPSRAREGEHVLLVDDEQALTDMEKFQLQRLGYQVTVAADGTAALEAFRAAPDTFHLVVTDQTMPGLTGLELSREILAIRPGLPIILCTGFSTRVDEATAKASGISTYAMKPLTRGELARLVRETLDSRGERPPS